jgi:hypothetical protein
MPPDLTLTYRCVDGDETVTLYRRLTESTFDGGTPIKHAKRFEATVGELFAAGALLQDVSLVWWLWQDTLGGVVPERNWVIQDAAAARWTVLVVDHDEEGRSYELTCIQELPVPVAAPADSLAFAWVADGGEPVTDDSGNPVVATP